MEKMMIHVSEFDNYNNTFSLWSKIYVQINGEYFPDDQWWDATSSVLEMWTCNINRLISGCINTCLLNFMDGDYTIKLTSNAKGEALAECIGPHETVVLSEVIDLYYFSRQILAAVEKLKVFYADYPNAKVIQHLALEGDKLRIATQNSNHRRL